VPKDVRLPGEHRVGLHSVADPVGGDAQFEVGVRSLGEVALDAGTVEHDLSLMAAYQEFSAELLRLSLASLAVIGFLIGRLPTTPKVGEGRLHTLFVAAALGSGVAAVFALLHKYTAVDSVAFHLERLRRLRRNAPGDQAGASSCRVYRDRLFIAARWSLVLSGLALAIAVAFLFLGFLQQLDGRAMPQL
jgi:hypothetical protein